MGRSHMGALMTRIPQAGMARAGVRPRWHSRNSRSRIGHAPDAGF